MATGTCDFCGREEYMPFVCKFCKSRYCAEHRLPENHACKGLDVYRERARSEGRWMAPDPVVAPRVSAGARLGVAWNAMFDRVQGKIAYILLGTMIGVFLLVNLLFLIGLEPLAVGLFFLDRTFYLKPWTLVTSVLTHLSLNHLFFNALVFFFFAPSLERLIGSRRFTYLFIGSGALAGIVQLAVFTYWLPTTGFLSPESSFRLANSTIIGASGGIMALFGTLTVLAPRLTILVFFVIPAPLWLLTIFYALFDVLGVFSPGDGVAHLAHLAGLVVGLAFGKHLHDQGLRVRVQTPESPLSRRF